MTNIVQNNKRIALVIGATGGIGGEVAHALAVRGWHVRALSRNKIAARQRASWLGQVEWVEGDAMIEADVVAAAQGATVIFHGGNPPGYKNWRGLAMPMFHSALAAARISGARLIFPGNVYNFGPDAGATITETSPQHPLTRKGRIRAEMETMLQQAAQQSVRSIVIRAGDFFGPRQPASWFKDGMLKPGPGRKVTAVMYPGAHDVGHCWAYLPDFAAAIAQVADVESALPAFDSFNFGGHWLERGVEMADAILRVAGVPDAPISAAPWWLFRLASPLVTFMREALEMRYLWEEPLRLDNRKLVALIGQEPRTPLDEAVRQTLAGLDCLQEAGTLLNRLPSLA